jgi:hypothetical protein
MNAKLTMPLAFLALIGCSHQPAPASPSPARSQPVASAVAETEAPAPAPAAQLAEADQLYTSQLGASRAGQFETDHQVAALKRAVLLYQQFIERAEGQPEMAAAVRRSRERIRDLCETALFLREGGDKNPEDACQP